MLYQLIFNYANYILEALCVVVLGGIMLHHYKKMDEANTSFKKEKKPLDLENKIKHRNSFGVLVFLTTFSLIWVLGVSKCNPIPPIPDKCKNAKEVFADNFDNNDNYWELSEKTASSSLIEKGIYTFSYQGDAFETRCIGMPKAANLYQPFKIEMRFQLKGAGGICIGKQLKYLASDTSGNAFQINLNSEKQSLSVEHFIRNETPSLKTLLPSAKVSTFNTTDFHKLTLLKEGSQFEVLLDDQSIGKFQATAFSPKEIGFVLAGNSSISVDWLKIESCE